MMRFAIDIWEAARNGDVDRLERVIFWTEDGSGVQIMQPSRAAGWAVARAAGPCGAGLDRRARISATTCSGASCRGDLVKPALHYVQSTINEQLEGRASPRLLWDAKRERLGLYIVPDGLIGALWLQFARAVERDSKFRQCAECGIWFELAPGTARADKLYLLHALPHQGLPQAAGGGGRGCTARGARSRTSPASWTAIPTPCAAGSSARAARADRPRARLNSRARAAGWAQYASSASDDLDRCLAGANPLAPDLMTAEERLTEVAQILAAGLLRLRRRAIPDDRSSLEKNSLDFSPGRSGHATARQRRQVGR